MAMISHTHEQVRHQHKRGNDRQFRLIFGAAFVVFLIAHAIDSVLSLFMFKCSNESTSATTIVGRAREAANRCAAYAFMG